MNKPLKRVHRSRAPARARATARVAPTIPRIGFPRPCIVGAGLAPAHVHQLKKRDDKTRLHLRRYQQYERSDINRQRSLVMSSVTYVGTRLKAILEEDAKRLA